MSDSRNAAAGADDGAQGAESGSAPEARGTGSSLTDAVVAALANVSTPPPTAPAEDVAPASPTVVAGTATDKADTIVDAPVASETQATGEAQPSTDAQSDRSARDDDATEPLPTQEPVAPDAASAQPEEPPPAPAQPGEGTLISSSEGEPTVRLGGAVVQHLTSESAKEAPEGIVVQYYGRTDVGLVREHNEDNFLVVDLSQERRGLGETPAILKTTLGDRGLVLAVCDGMGGAAAGEVASQMAVDTIYEVMQAGSAPKDRDQFARRLVRAVEEAGARIFSAAKMDRTRRGMGTTATVAGLIDSTLFVGQVGDSRAYVLRGDQLALITKDQSLVNQLIEAGQLTEEEAEAFEHSNIILQALGTTEEVTVDLTFLELRRGDRLMMCSDGLSGLVHGDMMREVLKSSRDLSEAAAQLIAMANAGGGHDNITVIVAEFDGAALRPASSEVRVAYQQYPLPPADPADVEPLPPRPTTMKSGGPKPGADVKVDASRDDAGVEGSGSGRWWFAGLVLLLILVCVAAVIVLMDTGEHTSAADSAPTTRVTIESTVSRRAASETPRVARGRVIVDTDVEQGLLYVDGAVRTEPVRDEMILTLPVGEHRIEVRQGAVRVAEARVNVEAGGETRADLRMPAGALPEGANGEELTATAPLAPPPSSTSITSPPRVHPVRATSSERSQARPAPAQAPAEPGSVL